MMQFGFRAFTLLLLAFSLSACELVGNVLQFGFWTGVVVVLLIVGIIMWLGRRFRG